jgi:hypothetical protein
MLKAYVGKLVIFGLSELNLQRLRDGKPIDIDLRPFGHELNVVIFYGKTEEDMRRDLAEFIGPETQYSDTTRKDS